MADKSKAIKDDERELYEYALYSIVLLLSPAFISIAIGCIMGIPINGVLMVIPFLFLRKFSGDSMPSMHVHVLWVHQY